MWTGWRRDALVGQRRFTDLLTPGGRIFHETHYAPMLRMQGHVREIAVDLVCADGTRLPVLVNAVLKRDELGEPAVVRLAVFDATERREYERELVRARQRAEASESRARVLAETLQASLIPPETPVVPGYDVAGAYRPAGAGDEVGGDFYDVFETGDGEWAVVLGDVCGKGAEAATVTALARYTIRAAAMQDPSPSHVLRTLNEAIIRQGADRYCTAVYVQVGSVGGGRQLTVCVGGHLLPLLLRPSGPAVEVGAFGTALGLLDDVELVEVAVQLDHGDALVLFTDGVTEASRRQQLDLYGHRRLAATLEAGPRAPAQAMVDHLVADVLAFQQGVARDDIAVVAVRAPEVDA